MPYVNGEIHIIGHAGVNAGVAYDFAGDVNKLRYVKPVDFRMEIAESFGGGLKSVPAFFHREDTGMDSLTAESHPTVEHAENAVYYAYVFTVIFKYVTLLDMRFKHILVFIRRNTLASVALERRFVKSFTEGFRRVKYAF